MFVSHSARPPEHPLEYWNPKPGSVPPAAVFMLGKKCMASEDAAVAQGAWFIAPKGLVERSVAAATPIGRRRGLRELRL